MVQRQQRIAVDGIHENQVGIVIRAQGAGKPRRHKVVVNRPELEVAKNKAQSQEKQVDGYGIGYGALEGHVENIYLK